MRRNEPKLNSEAGNFCGTTSARIGGGAKKVSSAKVPIYPGNPKSRERTFDLLTLVPASPRSVMAPPPSPAVQISRKRGSPEKDCCGKTGKLAGNRNDVDDDEFGIGFFFGEREVEDIDNVDGIDIINNNDNDNSNYNDNSNDNDDEVGDNDDDFNDEKSSLSESHDVDKIERDASVERIYDDENVDINAGVNINNDARADNHQEQSVQKSFEDELRMDLLATQSLGPRLTEAFDLVRMIDFEGPWVSSNDWRMLAAMNKARRSLQLPGNGLGFDSEDGVQVNICLKSMGSLIRCPGQLVYLKISWLWVQNLAAIHYRRERLT